MQWKCRLHIFIKYIHVCLKILNYFFHPLSKQFFVLNKRTGKHLINSYTCTMLNTYIISLSTVVYTCMKVHVSTMKYTKLASDLDDRCLKNSHETPPPHNNHLLYVYIYTTLRISLKSFI